MAQHNELGHKGEQIAIKHLTDKGYRILENNWRYQKAEIDIIAQKNDLLIAVEVKTRSTSYFGNPETFVNAKKIQLSVKALDAYIQQNDIDLEVRFDIIAVLLSTKTLEIKHLKDAFLYF